MTVTHQTSALTAERGFYRTGTPWLLTARVTIPERVDGYLRRPQLLSRCQPLNRRLTVFHAPCGFGKTTLLTDICRRERARGVVTAWLRLDGADTFDVSAAYIGHALERAGLDVSALRSAVRNHSKTSERPEHAVRDWMGLLMRAIENYRMPCLFALDEVERLADAEQIRLIDFLLRRAPRNLHFAMTMRNNPPGLDLATAVLDQRGDILRADDLRFSKPEIALFYGGRLSRRELVEVTELTEGWPAALRVHRNTRTGVVASRNGRQGHTSERVRGYRKIASDFVATRLLRDLKDEERDYLLDVSLFDSIDLSVMNEVLPDTHPKCGADVLSMLEGLVRPVDASAGVLRLHPLVREYCAARRLQEAPVRFRMLHGRIAAAMARRGRLISALRHAADSGDSAMVGSILENAGGVWLLPDKGMAQFYKADRFLTSEVLAAFPRLALARCVALFLSSNAQPALSLYRRVGKETDDFCRDRNGGDDRALRSDSVFVRAVLASFTCQPFSRRVVKRMLADASELAADEKVDRLVRGGLLAILSVCDYQRARFESSQLLGTRAKECFALADTRYGTGFVDFQQALVAMAEGRVREAMVGLTRVVPTAISEVFVAELKLERNRLKSSGRRLRNLHAQLRSTGGWFDVHAAALGVVAELVFEKNGSKRALQIVEESLDHAATEDFSGMVRYLSALRVSYLVADGRDAEASAAWQEAKLPDDESELLDMDAQTWREMESLCCARIRLLAARSEFEAARRLAEKLREATRERGLMRTLMRCIALWMSVEYRAGNMNAAASRLLEFLRLLRVADYPRPLVREREIGTEVLRRVLGTALKPELRASAESMLRQLGAVDTPSQQRPMYTAREIEVLERVEQGLRDKQIARHLGLTEHGVRYHLKNIFRKMGATGRMDAVRRARALGLVP